MSKTNRIILAIILLLTGPLWLSGPGNAQRPTLIRDTETEDIIRAYSTPIFKAAGLKASEVKIYIVKDDTLNAFVAGGQKLFINTGLILQSDSANQIIGVIAHETGHIAGGHLSRVHDALSKSSTTSILTAILGGAAAVTTGRGDLGAAIIAGGHATAVRNFLAYSRVQEGSADHAAIKYLEKTKQSAKGLLQFMEKLGDQELLSPAQQDPYVRSHPLTRERIATLADHVASSAYSEQTDPMGYEPRHQRMKAKILAFLKPYAFTLRVYKKSDQSVPSRYARAVAEYRRAKLEPALVLINGLIAEAPHDPYFHELKGQMLFEHGRTAEAISAYGRAAELLPGAPLIRRDLARAQLDSNDPALLDQAITNLEVALVTQRDSASNWRFLAIAYGRKGEQGRSFLALAEEALLKRKPEIARFQAGRAKKIFARGSRSWLQAEDILLAADELDRVLKREKSR